MKLLYVTPEQLVASRALEDALCALQRRGLLARLVVDEACPALICVGMHVGVRARAHACCSA